MNLTDEEKLIKEKIMRVAQKLAVADGLYNISITEILEAATGKISEETFYKFFKDKDELLKELVATRFGLDDEDVLKLPIDEKIKMFTVKIMIQVETATVKDYKNWLAINAQANENSDLISDKRILRKFLDSSLKAGELTPEAPLEDILEFIVSLTYGLTFNWAMTNAEFEPLEHLDTINELIINSLIPYIIK